MKIKNWIQLLFLIGLLGFGFIYSRYKDRSIENCSKEAVALVIDKHRRKGKGYFIKYKYQVGDEEYFTSESIKKNIDEYEIGKSIQIVYSCKNPDFSTFKTLE